MSWIDLRGQISHFHSSPPLGGVHPRDDEIRASDDRRMLRAAARRADIAHFAARRAPRRYISTATPLLELPAELVVAVHATTGLPWWCALGATAVLVRAAKKQKKDEAAKAAEAKSKSPAGGKAARLDPRLGLE